MHAFVLQDWVTIQGGAATITQSEQDWLDLSPYQDVTFWLHVTQASGSPSVTYQTSPSEDDVLFQSMTGSAVALAGGTVTVTKVIMESAPAPVARFVRWQVTGTPPWQVTFRIFVAANLPGMRTNGGG